MTLTPSQLLALDRLAPSPLTDVRTQDAALYKQLAAKVGDQRKQNVTASFTGVSAPLQAALTKVDFKLGDKPDKPLRQVIFEQLAAQRVTAEVAQEATERVLELERSSAFADPAAVTVPLRDHELFQDEMHRAQVLKIGLAASLNLERAGKLIEPITSPVSLSDAEIRDLVDKKVVSRGEAADLGLTASLYHLVDDQVEIAEGLRKGLTGGDDDRDNDDDRDDDNHQVPLNSLAAIGRDRWLRAIRKGRVTPPKNLSAEQYATLLDATVTGLFPTDALMARILPAKPVPRLERAVELVQPYLSQAPDRSLHAVEIEDSDGDVRAAHVDLVELANAHPGLRLHEVLADDASPDAIATAVANRVDLVGRVYRANAATELLTLDYSPDSADVANLNFDNMKPAERTMVLGDLKAFQRTFALTDSVPHTATLLRAGYHSAVAVQADSLTTFTQKTGLAVDLAERYYLGARGTVSKITTSVVSIIDLIRGGFSDLGVANVLPSIADQLRKLDGFSDLFGSQDFCNCTHCQSILSPAAYFVDLMKFVDEQVRDVYFTGAHAGDQLDLRTRRPDLWTLPLTCANTDTLIPYLDIINEVLENWIARRLGFTGDLADRSAIEDLVYRQQLATVLDSFRQPFTLPLEKIAAYLAHFERTRGDVADTLAAPEAVRVAAALGFAKAEYDIVTTPNTNIAFLNRIYGEAFVVGAGGVIDPVDAQRIVRFTGLTRDHLGDLATARFVTADGAEPITFVSAKRGADSVQNDIERIHGLRASSLDRLHRFARLTRTLPWSIAEVDLVLGQVESTGVAAGLGAGALAGMADVLAIHWRFGLSAEQNCALWSGIPRVALANTKGSLFDRLFNTATFVKLDGTLPKDTVRFVHPSLRTTGVPSPADNTLHRLLAALGASDDQLAQLIAALAGPLGANPAAPNENDRGFLLTSANLTLLYRHARLAQLLRLQVPDLFQLIRHAGLAGQVAGTADLRTLLEFHDWWKPSGYTLDDLGLITHTTIQRPGAYPDPAALAATIVSRVALDRDLEFADTVFAFLPGITEDQSRAVIAANAASLEPTPDAKALRLKTTFNPGAPLVVPAGVTVPEPELRAALLKHHSSRVLSPRLAAQLSLAADRVDPLVAMTGVGLASAPIAQALQGGAIGPLVSLVSKLVPLSVLFRSKVYDSGGLAFLRTHGAIFGIVDFTALTIANVRKLAVYGAFAAATQESDFTPQRPLLDPADLAHVFTTFDPAQRFANTDQTKLAAVLRTEPAMVATLLPHLALPATAPEALSMLGHCVELATFLGLGGDALALMVSDVYGDLNRASEAMLSAFRAKYPDEEEFADKLAPFEDRIRGARRDGLTDYLIRTVRPEFDDHDDIYEYFLLDCQLEGCARTSRLVAAISSVQLYLHRVLMNLEQDRREPTDPARVAVLPKAIPADEWSWRKNYRVWEANRKVFLWPENYIEPELRDDKTPLFKDLESRLLQQEISDQNVLDAYADYLTGFGEVAKLAIAGAYHDKDTSARTDVLHLFGVTPGDPPTYYYRTIDNAHYGEIDAGRGVRYGPWKKIDVQIPVRRVAPVVHLGRLFAFWVETVTTPKNEVKDAGSNFVGYKHHLTLKFTTLRMDGAWTPPQSISLRSAQFPTGDGIVEDPLAEKAETDAFKSAVGRLDITGMYNALVSMATPRYDTKVHSEPIDGYTVEGFAWDRVYPQRTGNDLALTGRNFIMRASVDFYRREILPRAQRSLGFLTLGRVISSRPESGGFRIYSSFPIFSVLDDHPQAMVVADQRRINALGAIRETAWMPLFLGFGLYQAPLARAFVSPDITVVNGSIADSIVDLDSDLLYFQGGVRPGKSARYLAKRLGTTLGENMSRLLFSGGVNRLLATQTQLSGLFEQFPRMITEAGVDNEIHFGSIDFRGSFGTYYREVFFHIPFLIANQLNSQQKFASAQRWYHYIFDPTASESIAVPAGTPPEQRKRMELDRVWRYSEFRGLDLPKLRAILTDPAAIEVYKKDPFNPHAIARLRLSAYQKCIVMKYIDNLLDWGDSLFAQFTMESVNEATMQYVTASQILGRRPAQLGSCGESPPRTYEKLAPLVHAGSEFLLEIENFIWTRTGPPKVYGPFKRNYTFAFDRPSVRYFADQTATRIVFPGGGGDGSIGVGSGPDIAAVSDAADDPAVAPAATATPALGTVFGDGEVARFPDWNRTFIASWAGGVRGIQTTLGVDNPWIVDFERIPKFGWGIIRQLTPAFCVPANRDLLGLWDRVEDRLFKIRHCLDISGVPRQLALFAPEIDPRLLVRARAAGLSIEDVLGATSGDLPPYRFQYLIEKAKQHTAAVQSFGGALLSALEKRDIEELNRLRTVHTQNLLKLTTRVRDLEIDIAADTIATLDRQKAAVTYRRDYYHALLEGDLNPAERVQQVSRHVASASFVGGALLNGTAGVLSLLPQLGSPFAMKYGGVELGSSLDRWAKVLGDTAKVAEVVAASAGLEAGFARRREGWEHQQKLAQHELDQLDKQASAAELRRLVAMRSLEIHQKQIEQQEEIFELYGSRFTNLALYTWLSTNLQRIYREAYNSAYGTARLAEQAYRFERGDETTPLLRTDYFDATRAGLLAGEQLLVDLDTMERRFIETNYRTPEVDQSFSLAQIDPAALVRLRETGECEFDIGEVFFDLFYPGQFRRRIKAVRLTIPSVTGPYTNVGASLSLTGSRIRREAKLGVASVAEVPLRRSVAIATSTAQYDAGVFEFSFRDERYMPFEGAGAVSSWRLVLPKSFRPFDYQTITDVVMHISYTADEDALFRTKVEQMNAAIEGTILNYLSNNPLARVYSLRQDFSGALNRLIHSPSGTPVQIELTDRHLPIFLRGRPLQVTAARLALRTPSAQTVSGVTIRVDTTDANAFTRDPALGNLHSRDVAAAFAGGLLGEHTLTVVAPGDLAPDTPEPGDPSTLDPSKLLDVALYLELHLA